MTSYNDEFYEYNIKSSGDSATEVFPLIASITKVNSVVDFGCGRGTWLNQACDVGADVVVGLDGTWNADKQINPSIEFLELSDHVKLRKRTFDLAISLEVFEHLEAEFCDELIETMVCCSGVIVFAGAFPRQGGTDHINEQFPSYWAEKFAAHGYLAYDFFRPKLWGNDKVDRCYQQNMFLYVNKENNSELVQELDDLLLTNTKFMDAMHPGIFLNRSGRDAVGDLFHNLVNVLKQRFG